MKKFLSMVLAAAVISVSLPAYAYSRTTFRNEVTELRDLIAQCKAQGINTQYEEIDTNIIATYTDRIGDVYEGNVSSSITSYQVTELTTLYNNAKANLQGYLAGTKQPPEKVYTYETGYDFSIDGKSLIGANGAPYYSIGFGHFGLYPYVEELNSYGYDNVQAVIGLTDAIGANRTIDSWDKSTSGGAEVTFTVSNEGHSNNTSLNVVNESSASSGRFGRLFQRIAVKPNTSYVISFYAKGTAASSAFAYTTDEGMHNTVTVSGLNTNSWKKITASFTTGEDEFFKGFTFMFYGKCDLYIDDVTVHRSGDSKNLIRNGGFDGDGHSDFDIIYESDSSLNSLLRTLYAAEKNNTHVDVLLQLQQQMPQILSDKYSNLVVDGRYNVDLDIAKEAERAYIEAIADLITEYSSLSSICLVNEPNYNTSNFASYYNSKFATYLQNKHGNISTLNSLYGKSYSSFASVGMPTSFESTARYYDWKNFNDSVFIDWYARTVAIIKGCIPGIPVSIKTQSDFSRHEYTSSSLGDIRGVHMGRGANMELLAGYSDIHGNDAVAVYESDHWVDDTLKWYDYLGSISDKPIYNSENHLTKSGEDDGGPTEWSANVNKFVKRNIWQSAMHGLDMSSIWTWSLTTDSTAASYGHLAMRPSVIADAAKTNLDINRVASKAALISNAAPDLAILRSDASRIYNANHMGAISLAYNAAIESGHKVGFVTANNIASKLSSYSTLVIPSATNVESSVINAINSFSGTIIILDNNSLGKTEYNKSYSGDMLTKVNNIKSRATKSSISTNSSNEVTSPTKATLANTLKSGRTVTVTNSDNTATADVEWQYVPYKSGYLVNVANHSSSTKNLSVKINGTKAAKLTSLADGAVSAGSINFGSMGYGLYYASNSADTVPADNFAEPARKPQIVAANDITSLNGTRSGNVNTLTWKAQSYGKYNVYEVKADGALEFIGDTYDECFDDESTGAKTYVVKSVTDSGESEGKALTLGFNTESIPVSVTNNAGSSTVSIDYTNSNAFAIAVTVKAVAKNADNSFAGAVIVEKIIPAGKTVSFSKTFKTSGTGSITVTKK